MFKRLKENEKGLTLIELLVVIVILGIIAAIAIVAIGGIIDNSKKDAHVSNAKQIANAAKLYEAGEDAVPDGTPITLEQLYAGNYLEKVKDPSTKKGFYDVEKTKVVKVEAKKDANGKVTTAAGYEITLVGDNGTYVSGKLTSDLTREDIKLKE